jgi:hypothetical protein
MVFKAPSLAAANSIGQARAGIPAFLALFASG